MKALCAVLCLVVLAIFAGCSQYQPGYYSHYGAKGSFPGTGCSSCAK